MKTAKGVDRMIKVDYHVHTNFSADADRGASMAAMIEQAIASGLHTIALTDHVDFLSDGSPFPHQIDYDSYIVQFNRLKEKYEKQIDVILGVEMGLGTHLVDQFEAMAAKYPFEFIIGSTHELNKRDIYDFREEVFAGKTKQQAYELYFTETLNNIKHFSAFNVYGHLDYVPRYGIYADNSLRYDDFKDVIDDVLRALVDSGKGLELNTSGFRYGLGHAHPQLDILKRFKVLGGDIVTVGSDAHRPLAIAEHFDKAADILKAAGYKAYTVFKERKPVWIDL